MVTAVDADDEHQIGDHTNRRLRAVDLGLYRKFVGGGRLRVAGMACAPAQISRRFDRFLRVRQRVSDRLMLDDRMNAAEFDRSCLFPKPLWDQSRKVSDAGARFLGLWRTRARQPWFVRCLRS